MSHSAEQVTETVQHQDKGLQTFCAVKFHTVAVSLLLQLTQVLTKVAVGHPALPLTVTPIDLGIVDKKCRCSTEDK